MRTPNPSLFGRRLHDRRRMVGLTQIELAHAVELSPQTISHVEIGRIRTLQGDVVVRLARCLGVTTDWLLGVEPDGK